MGEREFGDVLAMPEQSVFGDEELGLRSGARGVAEGRRQILHALEFARNHVDAARRGRALDVFEQRDVLRMCASAARTAMRRVAGRASMSTSSRFPPSTASLYVTPVKLPPGCARLSATPSPIGSGTKANTTGLFRPACLSARTAGDVIAMTISGVRAASPATSALSRSGSPSPAEHLDRRRAAVFVAELLKRLDQKVGRRAVGVSAVQDGDARPLLRARRPRARRGEQPGDERAPPHSITSSAGMKRTRNRQAEGVCRLRIDYELERGRLLHGICANSMMSGRRFSTQCAVDLARRWGWSRTC